MTAPTSSPRKQVLIRPLWDMGLRNKVFDTIYPWSLTCWREAAAELGIAIDTWDMMPLDRADCVWFLDLPDRRSEFDAARRAARPGTPFVLQVMESPVGRMHNLTPSNQARCDHVVTYQQQPGEPGRHFTYRLPHSLAFRGSPVPYEQRKGAIMVNTNRVEGYFAIRQRGLTGIPGIGRNLSGWDLPAWTWLNPARGELYSWRRQLARTAARIRPGLLDVVGAGWKGERISWCPLYPRRPYPNCIASQVPDKLQLAAGYRFCISVENFRGSLDYISEKIIDPLVAGSVPVYLGEESITRTVPAASFVDVRHFKSQRELLLYLDTCPRAEWESMHAAGQAYLRSDAIQAFSTATFVRQMNEILLGVLGLPR